MKPDAETRALQKHVEAIQRQFAEQAEVKDRPLPDGVVQMCDIIPEGTCDGSSITHYTVDEKELMIHNLRMAIHKEPEMMLTPGRYTRLTVDGELMMTDAPFEARSNHDILSKAKGNVLIGGLGIGMILVPILRNPAVKRVVVLEKYRDVIKLVEKPLRAHLGPQASDKLLVMNRDVFTFVPSKDFKKKARFDAIYMDIWPTISVDNLKDMVVLKRRFKPLLKKDGWLGCWLEDYLKRKRVKNRREDRLMFACVGGKDPSKVRLHGSTKDFKK